MGELPADMQSFQDANFLQLTNPLKGLQKLAEKHREQFQIPVIGITGSNGKTIVKEWLYQLLSPDRVVTRSPRSYNSQIGVPLSVWLMNEHTEWLFLKRVFPKWVKWRRCRLSLNLLWVF